MDYAIAPSSIEPSATIYSGTTYNEVNRNQKTIGFCNVGTTNYTEINSKDHPCILKTIHISVINTDKAVL